MCNALSQNISVYFKLLYSKCAQNHMTSGVSFYVLSMKWKLRCPQPASETSVSRWQRCMKPFMNFYLKNRHRWDLFVFSTPCLWQLVDQRLESCVSIYRCCFWGSMPVSKCIWRGSWLGLELLMMEDRSMGKCAALPWKPANDWSMLIWQSSTSCFALKRSSTSFPVGVPRCFTFYWKRILNITWILDMSLYLLY